MSLTIGGVEGLAPLLIALQECITKFNKELVFMNQQLVSLEQRSNSFETRLNEKLVLLEQRLNEEINSIKDVIITQEAQIDGHKKSIDTLVDNLDILVDKNLSSGSVKVSAGKIRDFIRMAFPNFNSRTIQHLVQNDGGTIPHWQLELVSKETCGYPDPRIKSCPSEMQLIELMHYIGYGYDNIRKVFIGVTLKDTEQVRKCLNGSRHK